MSHLVRGACLFTLVLCVAAVAHAQVNAETLAEGITAPGFGGAGKSSLSFFRGNINLIEVRGEVTSYYASAHPEAPPKDEQFWFRDRVLLYGSAGLKQVSGQKIANDGFAHARYTRMQWLWVGGEVYGQAQYDRVRLLSRRLVTGAGLRVIAANFTYLRAWGGTGYMAEFERRKIPEENRPPNGPDPVNMTNHRFSNYATVIVPIRPNQLNLNGTAYVQPRFDYFRDIQILAEAHLVVSITDHLKVTTDFMFRYDSRAPIGVKRHDYRLGNGIAFNY